MSDAFTELCDAVRAEGADPIVVHRTASGAFKLQAAGPSGSVESERDPKAVTLHRDVLDGIPFWFWTHHSTDLREEGPSRDVRVLVRVALRRLRLDREEYLARAHREYASLGRPPAAPTQLAPDRGRPSRPPRYPWSDGDPSDFGDKD